MDILEKIEKYTGISKYADEVPTPVWVSSDMVDLIPPELFRKDSTFLDIYCKSGRFLKQIYYRLMSSEYMKLDFPDEEERHRWILDHQLFAIAGTEYHVAIIRKEVYGDYKIQGNVTAINRYADKIKTGNFGQDEQGRTKSFRDILSEEFNQMKFDCVIGNPPYNDDIYIPFVELGHALADKCSAFITPAKWQAKGGQVNERFRKNIVPYMSDIVFYNESKDVFDIAEPAGITYYMVDNIEHTTKNITNKCKANTLMNSEMQREIGTHLSNLFINIIDKVTSADDFIKTTIDTSRAYFLNAEKSKQVHQNKGANDVAVYGADANANKLLYGYYDISDVNNADKVSKYKAVMHFKTGLGYGTLSADGKAYGLKIFNIYEPGEVCKDDFLVLYTADTKQEVEYFYSYYKTKLIMAMAYCGCCGANASNQETWKFIPKPKAFDHIFTDQELYEKYNLTDDEINIIESVIKERK